MNHVPYTTFRAQWILANIAGSLIALASFALIAHGITGPHDEQNPTLGEIAAHGLGLVVAGAFIAAALKLVLRRHTKVARWFVSMASIGLTTAFLFGAYVLRPPLDFLLAYAVVGALVDFARSPTSGRMHPVWRSMAVSALWFTTASFVGMLALSFAARAAAFPLGAPDEDLLHHLITMAAGGLFIGAATGIMTAHRFAIR